MCDGTAVVEYAGRSRPVFVAVRSRGSAPDGSRHVPWAVSHGHRTAVSRWGFRPPTMLLERIGTDEATRACIHADALWHRVHVSSTAALYDPSTLDSETHWADPRPARPCLGTSDEVIQ